MTLRARSTEGGEGEECHKGKACGNTCISRAYTCHQPPGCACDAQ